LTDKRWLTVSRTLCFLRNGDDILLLRRAATARIFPGKYNGVGGHIERGEDPLTCARREIREETALEANMLTLKAVYSIDAGAPTGITVYVFLGEVASRDFRDSGEGMLQWVAISELSQFDLVDDLQIVLPRILASPPGAQPLFIQMRYNQADELVLNIVE
jgi:8-oxo-dGTP diphosphatase